MSTILPQFVIDALIAGSLLALVAGVLGPFVVSGKQSVASDMLAHLALAGVGIGVVAGILPTHGALAVLVLASILLWALLRYGHIAPDALAMFFLTGGLAVALIFMHMAKNTTVSFEAFLFGSILTVTQNDIFEMGLMSIIVLCFVFVFWYRLLGVVQTPEYVEPYGTRAPLFHLAFLLLLALTVWIGLTTVGGLLTGALLVIPVLTARPYAHSFAHLVFGATLVSITSVWIGIFISLILDVPTSSAIVLTVIALFLVSETVHRVTH